MELCTPATHASRESINQSLHPRFPFWSASCSAVDYEPPSLGATATTQELQLSGHGNDVSLCLDRGCTLRPCFIPPKVLGKLAGACFDNTLRRNFYRCRNIR